MLIAIIVILFAVGMFLVLHDDHDNSYTKNEKQPTRQRDFKPASQKPAASQGNTPRPARFAESQPERPYRPGTVPVQEMEKPVLDFHFLDRIEYHSVLPEQTMSSFITGLQGHCTDKDLGGLVGWIEVNPNGGGLEAHASPDGRLMGYLPMKDRAAFLAFNPGSFVCPFAGHVDISVTGKYYADIRIVLPASRDFVEEALVGFLG
ncbi:MAG: hypothetical protein IKV62_03455 [Bacteroidales bacterium]|nr:hypothetical protein [Bacteroidales bacterium]